MTRFKIVILFVPVLVYYIYFYVAPLYLFMLFVILLLIYYSYWKFFIQMNSSSDFQPGLQLKGIVVSVYDGDGFEFYHIPWYFHTRWFLLVPRSLYVPSKFKRESTLSIRLAGIDAPEIGKPHLGLPAQDFSSKAKKQLEELVLDNIVKLKLLKRDPYERILASCYLEGLFSITNVNKKMVELGMACVYTGGGAVYDDYKDDLLRLERKAKEQKIGMWSRKDNVLPKEYKREFRN